MSKVHDAMRRLAHNSPAELNSRAPRTHLVGALIEELADEVPDEPSLEAVRTDLLAAGHACESGADKEMALRFYLAFRLLLREHSVIREQLKNAELAEAANTHPQAEAAAASVNG